MHTFKENIKLSYGVSSTELGAESSDKIESGTFVDMAKYGHVWLIGHVVGCTSASAVSLIALEATSTAGAGSATLSGKTDVFTSTHATHTGVLQVEVDSSELTTGYQYVGLRLITTDTGGNEIVGGVICQGNPRYGQATLA